MSLGGYDFTPEDTLVISQEALGHDPEQWQRPTEFLPRRFDQNDKLSLTPDGQKRHTGSWVPFNGASETFFGKALAEAQIKILATYMSQLFDMQFEDERYRDELPFA